jgi:REP element-mobilizing transposase RayT
MVSPLYLSTNIKPAYQLRWSLTVFWQAACSDEGWLSELAAAAEPDGVRVLEHRFAGPGTSQFLVSTQPDVTPTEMLRSIKGRLQYLLRSVRPKAFRRHHSIHSLGDAHRAAIEQYVATQLDHHRLADPRMQSRLAQYQIDRPDVDLSSARASAHGRFRYNLHLVFVRVERHPQIGEAHLQATRERLLGTANKHGHLLRRAGILADHVHLAVGCGVGEAPLEVALTYMNNLAHLEGMRPVLEFGCYLGTFGEYDMDAVRRKL